LTVEKKRIENRMLAPTPGMVYDVDKKTGRYIIGKDRLEDYAQAFLSKYCPNALKVPMPLPVEEILKTMGLTIEEANLSDNKDVYGCCFLLDGEVEIYDEEQNSLVKRRYPEKTVLIDPVAISLMGEGAKRNTLTHEAIHWHKDKTFFDVLRLKSKGSEKGFSPILCKRSEIYSDPPEKSNRFEADLQWIEWQANRLAPRVLMPFSMFKMKATEVVEKYLSQPDNLWPCDTIIDELSEFFVVSRSSVKYRLIEVGLISRLEELKDFEAVYAGTFYVNDTTNFEPLRPVEAYELLNKNSTFKSWVDNGNYIFAEGYFVKNSNEFIKIKDDGSLALTAKAKKNLNKCALNITTRTYKRYPNIEKDVAFFSYLERQVGEVDRRIAIFDPELQSNLNYDPVRAYAGAAADITKGIDDEVNIAKIINDPTKSLCECLAEIMEYRKWKYPRTFAEHTHLYDDLFGKIKRNQQNTMNKETLLAICVGLKLKLYHIEGLMQKSNNAFNRFSPPDSIYVNIIERFPGLSIDDFNGLLDSVKVKKLGTNKN
jgi:hypothetical protein